MITEIAHFDVKPGMEKDFEAGVNAAVPLFKRAKGCKSAALQRSHEMPSRYRLFLQWTRWSTTPSISAAPPISRSGASWSAIVLHRRPMSNTLPRSCTVSR
jgi:Antibiotic biosynthesis monooxygenase